MIIVSDKDYAPHREAVIEKLASHAQVGKSIANYHSAGTWVLIS